MATTTRQECAVVVGAGLIGLLVLQALKARGWSRVYAVDLDDSRLALAKELGAEEVVDLVGMTPSAWHVEEDALAEAATWGAVTVTVSVLVMGFRRVAGGEATGCW